MSYLIYRLNHNTVRYTGAIRESDGTFEAGIPTISTTLKDPNGSPISGLTALSAVVRTDKQDYAIVLPGADLNLTVGSGYTLQGAATGSFANKITFEDVPCTVLKRQG